MPLMLTQLPDSVLAQSFSILMPRVGLLIGLLEMAFKCGALLLSLSFASAPVVADYCEVSCETAHTGDTSASPAHTGHHHAATVLSRIGQPPPPCSHDHSGLVGVAASSGAAPMRSLAPTGAAVAPASPLAPSLWMSAYEVRRSNSPPGTFLRGSASPLRV